MMPHGNAPVKMPTLCTFCLLSRLFRAGVYKSVFIEMNYIPILCANLEKGLCIQEGFDAELIDFYTLLSPCVAGEHSRNKFPFSRFNKKLGPFMKNSDVISLVIDQSQPKMH